MFKLPASGSKARELLGKDLSHVAEILAPENRGKLLGFGRALLSARRTIASDPAIKRVVLVCLGNCNLPEQYGRVVLISVGRRGGWKKEWDFGPL